MVHDTGGETRRRGRILDMGACSMLEEAPWITVGLPSCNTRSTERRPEAHANHQVTTLLRACGKRDQTVPVYNCIATFSQHWLYKLGLVLRVLMYALGPDVLLDTLCIQGDVCLGTCQDLHQPHLHSLPQSESRPLED